MNKKGIINYLKESNCEAIKEIPYKDDIIVLSFTYEYDNYEIEAAKAYANEECKEEKEGEIWRKIFLLPYLHDIATDNMDDIIEDIMDDYDIGAQYIGHEINEQHYKRCEFVAVFYNKKLEIDIDDILSEFSLNNN